MQNENRIMLPGQMPFFLLHIYCTSFTCVKFLKKKIKTENLLFYKRYKRKHNQNIMLGRFCIINLIEKK